MSFAPEEVQHADVYGFGDWLRDKFGLEPFTERGKFAAAARRRGESIAP
jgi:hypothetical protein